MTNTLLDISKAIDPATVAIYAAVNDIAQELNTPFIVVGASARDLVLHYGYGAPIQRATTDIDFGIQLSDWQHFKAFKEKLLGRNFKSTKDEHRIISADDIPLDIVPFGGIQDASANIHWPPHNDFVMSVLGFQEACDHAELVRIQTNPTLEIPVATLAGLALMKLIAWKDRPADKRPKDALDLAYLCTYYEKIPAINDGLYADQILMERYGWDIELAGSHRLGTHTRQIASKPTIAVILHQFDNRKEQLINDMCRNDDRGIQRLEAFIAGFKVSE